MDITAPIIVIPLRQPSGKKHINYLFIEWKVSLLFVMKSYIINSKIDILYIFINISFKIILFYIFLL
jgi:hypothetical protein